MHGTQSFRDSAGLPLQYSRARYYSLALRRWLQRDPLGYVDGMNLYEYVRSGPIGWVDPWGLKDYRLGMSDPTIKADSSAGAWNSEEWRIKMWLLKTEILKKLWIVETVMPNAVAHMQHYFGNTGKNI